MNRPRALFSSFRRLMDRESWAMVARALVFAAASGALTGLALLAAMYNKEAYPVSMKGITLTTLVAPITMPIAYWLAGLA